MDELRVWLSDFFGLGDSRIKMLKYLRKVSIDRPPRKVEMDELEKQFDNIASDCINSLIEDGYAAGDKATAELSPISSRTMASGLRATRYEIIEPYYITTRGIARLKELRRNLWIFSISLVSLFVSFAALFQGCQRTETDKNSSRLVRAEERRRQIQEQILEEEERQTALEREISGKLDELIASQSEQTGSSEDLRSDLSKTQISAVSQP